MRPRRYPYSRKRNCLDNSAINCNRIKAVDIKLDKSSLTFKEDKIIIRGQSITGNRTISVKTSEHDVLLTARKNHPATFVDGIFLDGVERVEFINHFENKDCEVLLTFNDRIENNPIPLNKVSLLEKLFGQTSNGQSLRDIVLQTLGDGS
jgi:hypothetical protein